LVEGVERKRGAQAGVKCLLLYLALMLQGHHMRLCRHCMDLMLRSRCV
jgi:hypothetical protein